MPFTTRSMIRRTYSYVTRVWPLIWVNKHVHTFVHVHIYSATQSILFQEREENICIWNILHTCNIIETILIFTDIAFNVTTWNLFFKKVHVCRCQIERRSLVRFWTEVPPVFISPVMNVSFLLANWLEMHKMRCIRQVNKNNFLFSAPEPKAQVHYCDHALSVVRLSVCLSVVNFSHFRLLL